VSAARAMARAAGQELGPLCAMTDQSAAPSWPVPLATAGSAVSAAVPAVPISPGTRVADAHVQMVYDLR